MARLRGKRWQASVTLDDKTRVRPTFKTEAEAVAWESAAKLAVERGKPLPPVKQEAKPVKQGNPLECLGPLYDLVCRTEWADARASLALKRNGRHVVEYFGRDKKVTELTSAEAAEMRAHFAEEGLAPATVNRKTAALSKMLTVAKDNGIITAMPKLRWNKLEQTRFRYLDEAEEKALLAYWEMAYEFDLHDLTVLLLDTGARCYSEMIPVRWEHFGPDFRTVTFWNTKTFKPRTVPLTSRSREILRFRKAQGKVWGPFSGMAHNNMRSRWDTMRSALMLPDVTPHTLRHTCCTRLVLGGVDVRRVMEWMGHTAIVTTMRYMQIRPTSLEEIVHVLENNGDKPTNSGIRGGTVRNVRVPKLSRTGAPA